LLKTMIRIQHDVISLTFSIRMKRAVRTLLFCCLSEAAIILYDIKVFSL